MSVVINDKPRQRTLKLRWPLSRHLTLSLTTLAVLLAIWWAVTAAALINPLFLPAPGQVLQKLLTIARAQGFMDATLWQHLAASLGRIVVALLAAGALQCKVIGLVRLLAVGSIADDTRDARLFQRGDVCGSQLVGHTQAR